MKKIAKNVYAETNYRGCNPGFVVTSAGVVMIDTPQMPTDAVKWREIIAKHGSVKYVINTEPHGDHYTGNYYFKGTVVAHEGTRQAILASNIDQMKERMRKTAPAEYALMKRFRFRPPTITLTKEMTLYVGDHTFKLINLPGHTPYQVAVYIPEEKTIFTSDNVFYKVPPWFQQAMPYEWLESLKRMEDMEIEVVVPGHGEVCDAGYFPEMRACVQEWVDTVNDTIKQGLALEEAINKVTILDRYQLDPEMRKMLLRFNVGRLYQVLKK
ncbi:MAG: MBL fold metallo-hydrolase [Dehalococcoidales bacterium]|nr:MBL fold metallo-hydrolase [Dehalococcoidales bacterium]